MPELQLLHVEVPSSTACWITLIVPCQLRCGDEALKLMLSSDLMRSLSVEPGIKDSFLSAVREVLMNAIEHGGKLDPEKQVRIDLLHSNRALSCFVKDPGTGFHIRELQHAAINNPPEDAVKHASIRETEGLRPGGYGILLARSFADELIYNEHGNEVVLVKYLV